jgi:hypothetical protein
VNGAAGASPVASGAGGAEFVAVPSVVDIFFNYLFLLLSINIKPLDMN